MLKIFGLKILGPKSGNIAQRTQTLNEAVEEITPTYHAISEVAMHLDDELHLTLPALAGIAHFDQRLPARWIIVHVRW
jgi:hypothetical protein